LVPRHDVDNRSNGKAHASADLPRLGSELAAVTSASEFHVACFPRMGKVVSSG
jgi:hypothetical protein